MGAVWYRARAELRRRWRATLALALLVGLVGAVVLTAVTGARRSASAYGRFRDASRSAHVQLETSLEPDRARLEQVARLPQVETVGRVFVPFVFPQGFDIPVGGEFTSAASPDGSLFATVDRLRATKGRAPDPDRPDELAITQKLAADLGLSVGQQLTFRSLSPEQLDSFDTGVDPEPKGPTVTMRVVGIVRSPEDLVLEASGYPAAYLTPAFYRTYRGSMAGHEAVTRYRLRRGEADVPAFEAAVRRIYADDPAVLSGDSELIITPASAQTARVDDAVHVVVVGLLLLMACAGVAGLVGLGQAIGRHLSRGLVEEPVLTSLGMSRSQRLAAAGLAIAPAPMAGTLLAAVGAALASPLMPISIARQAESDPGFSLDPAVLGLGVVALVLVLSALTAAAAWLATRSAPSLARQSPAGRLRPAAVARATAAAGLPPAATIGARMALEPGGGRTAVPVRSALAGAVLGVAGLAAAIVFAASLAGLVAHPTRYGWNWDASVPKTGPAGGGESVVDRYGAELIADPTIADLGAVGIAHARMEGQEVLVHGFRVLKGSVVPTVAEGRPPSGPDEVVLGTTTLRRLGVGIGGTVEAQGVDGPVRLRVVGRAPIPFVDTDNVSDGALMTRTGVDRLVPPAATYSELVLRWGPGHGGEADRQGLRQRVGFFIADSPPSDVTNLGRVEALPLVLAAFLALLAVLAVGHSLVISVRRRRRDLAVLKALGFIRRQVSATVSWQASLVVLIGLIGGIPLGVAAGRWAWGLVANGVGVVNRPEVPLAALALTLPAALLVANLVAALPAWTAARTRPALALRTE